MIYFDDELPPEIKPPRSATQRWLRRLLIALGVVLVFFWGSLRVLSTVGGDSPALRTGIENYLRSATGYQARIGSFKGLSFYPALALDIGDVELSAPRPAAPAGQLQIPGPRVASIGTLKISMGFWDMMLGRGRLRALDIEHLNFGDTLGLARPLLIDRAVMEKTQGTAARLNITGHYGTDAFTAWQSMLWHAPDPASGVSGYFSRPAPAEFSLTAPFLTLHGMFSNVSGGAHVTLDEIGAPEKIMTGDSTLHRPLGGGDALNGTLAAGKSQLHFTAQRHEKIWQSNFAGGEISRADLPAYQKLAAALRQIDPAIADQLQHLLPSPKP